jgi:hypothetical protein
MSDSETPSVQSDKTLQTLNRLLSACVACGVLGFGGVMAWQNRDAVAVPDRNAAWSSMWTKKLAKSRLPESQGIKFELGYDPDKMKFDPAMLENRGFQLDPQFSSNSSGSSQSRPRR